MGDFIPAQPVTQNYQTDDQFYDTQNGGGFDNFGQDNLVDEINTELDKLLGNDPATQGGQQGGATPNDPRFDSFLEEQRQQREYERQTSALVRLVMLAKQDVDNGRTMSCEEVLKRLQDARK